MLVMRRIAAWLIMMALEDIIAILNLGPCCM